MSRVSVRYIIAGVSLARGAIIFAWGFVSGVQVALYLFDLYDDGVADFRSGLLGLLMLLLGIFFMVRSARRAK